MFANQPFLAGACLSLNVAIPVGPVALICLQRTLPDGLNVGLASGMGAATVCPAWKQVTIRSLLNMTSGVPNYSETEEIGQIEVADLYHQFTPQELIGAVDPDNEKSLPPNAPGFYSNINNILAGLIIEAVSGMSYRDALTTLILKPLRLRDTFYADGPYPPRVLNRETGGFYENPACIL